MERLDGWRLHARDDISFPVNGRSLRDELLIVLHQHPDDITGLIGGNGNQNKCRYCSPGCCHDGPLLTGQATAHGVISPRPCRCRKKGTPDPPTPRNTMVHNGWHECAAALQLRASESP